jgi:hypothetical protein
VTQTTKGLEQARDLTFSVKVTVPPGMGDGKARRLLNKMLDVGYADAVESTDGDHGPDDDGGDAEAVVSMNFDQPRLPKANAIIVVIEGGCCTAVFARDPNVHVQLLDWDSHPTVK